MTVESAVSTRELTRDFPTASGATRRALDGIDLEVPVGQVHGLLGPNGAGKTTLCKILSTVLLPTSGTARVLGHDVALNPRRVRPLIGLAFGGDRGLYGRLTVEQNLRYWCALFDIPGRQARARTTEMVELFGLTGRAQDRVETLSRGWKQRVHLARAVLSEPQLLILDEPTAGLDPVAARDVGQLIESRLKRRCTILMSTHDLREAEALCDEVTVMGDGRALAVGSPDVLAAVRGDRRQISAPQLSGSVADELRGIGAEVQWADGVDGPAEVTFSGVENLHVGMTILLKSGITEFSIREAGLEEFYLGFLGARGIGE